MNLGMMLLAVWLILYAVSVLATPIPPVLMGVLALIAGILILVGK